MAFCSFTKDGLKNYTTALDNAFFTEYLPEADGDAVKVYLFGFYVCKNTDDDYDLSEFSKALFMSEEKVKDCFKYWEEFDLVSVISQEPFQVRYLPLSSFGKQRKFKAGKYDDFCKSLQSLINDSRMISTTEYSQYFSVMEDYDIKPEAMLMICKYCIDLKGENISGKYICAVAKDFADRGVKTVSAIEDELSDYNLKSEDTQKVLQALGVKRKADLDDYNLFNKWKDQLLFDVKAIIFAAKTYKAKNVNYLDEKLMELFAAKKFTEKEIAEYAKRQAELNDLAKKITRALSVYVEVLKPVIDNYLNPWLALGYNEDTLLFIANYCFTHRKKTLEDMNATINNLYEKGLVNLRNIIDYSKTIAAEDEFIRGLFKIIGFDRSPNEWDRNNLKIWRDWGFSDEMITEAAKISSGKTNAVGYMNSVLGNWKSTGVFTPDKISDFKQADIKHGKTMNDRNYTEEELSALIMNADKVEF